MGRGRVSVGRAMVLCGDCEGDGDGECGESNRAGVVTVGGEVLVSV